MTFQYRATCISQTGRIRDDNEDNFYFDGKVLPAANDGLKKAVYIEGSTKEILNLAVFDGMGGEVGGEIAAHTAAEEYKKQVGLLHTQAQQPSKFLDKTVDMINTAVYEKGKEIGAERIGTTAAIFYAVLNQVYLCNVGDSRVYRYRKGKLTELTVDDTISNPNIKNQHLTQFIGIDSERYSLTKHIRKGTINRRDVFLLCSDGLYNMVSEKDMRHILTKNKHDINQCAEELTQKAMDNGGEDNCTVILVEFYQESLLSKLFRRS